MALLFGRGRFEAGDLYLTAPLVEVAAPDMHEPASDLRRLTDALESE